MGLIKQTLEDRQTSVAQRDVRRRLWEISEVDATQYCKAFYYAFTSRHGSKGLAVEIKPAISWTELRGQRRLLVPDNLVDDYDPKIHAGQYFSFSFLLLGRLVLDEFSGKVPALRDIEMTQRFMAFSRGYGAILDGSFMVPTWETRSIDMFLDSVEQQLAAAIKNIH